MLARLALPETRARIRAEVASRGLNNWGRIPSWEAVQISISPRLPQTAGKTVAALAAARGSDPIDQICDHLIADSGATRVHVRRRPRQRTGCSRPEHRHIERNQFRRQCRQPLALSLRRRQRDGDIAAFDKAAFLQAVEKRGKVGSACLGRGCRAPGSRRAAPSPPAARAPPAATPPRRRPA